MKVLVIGGGGREHALAWKLSQSEAVARVFVAPGNAGTASTPRCRNVPLQATDLDGLFRFAREEAVDLTVVGPEAPLVAGIVDRFQAGGMAVFGPSRAVDRIEGSKAFAKAFMQRHDIPTARARAFQDLAEAIAYVERMETLPVIKASGLAGGKGVLLPETIQEAVAGLEAMLVHGRFGEAGATVLVEERLQGPELSVLALTDGSALWVMPPVQDHKRLLDGDRGPNTGGMGAFGPSPLATPTLLDRVTREILEPTLAGLAAEGTPYVGVLYAGLMLTSEGPKVLEFNCRFGDPEAQVILPLLESDLVSLLHACIQGHLDRTPPRWSSQAAVTVVMASQGYPGPYETGHPIHGIEDAEALGCRVFHAGTALQEGRPVTAGGRVLNVTGVGPDLEEAATLAYAGVDRIHFPGAVYRRDIARGRSPRAAPRAQGRIPC